MVDAILPQKLAQAGQGERPDAMLPDLLIPKPVEIRPYAFIHLSTRTAENCTLTVSRPMGEVKSVRFTVNAKPGVFMTICGWAEYVRAESSPMFDEDISVPTGPRARELSLAEIERVLETLIVLAHNQRRDFLAYLLVMALMQVREEDQGRGRRTH